MRHLKKEAVLPSGSARRWSSNGATKGKLDEREHPTIERDVAIAAMGTIQSVFHLPGRQTEGFLESLFTVMGVEARSAGSLNLIASFKQAVSGTACSTKR